MNQAGLNLLKSFEKCSLKTYRDSANIPTIGWGHTDPTIRDGLVINQQQADLYLTHDLANVTTMVEHCVQVPVNDNQFAALCCLAYNIGITGFKNSTVLHLVNSQRDPSDAFMMWNKIHVPSDEGPKLIVSTGLTNRRHAEVELYNSPVSGAV